MQVIDLIDDIRNNKTLPKKIKVKNYIFELNEYPFINSFECIYTDGARYWLRNFDEYDFWLSSDVEIIEEDKEIEKIYHCCMESDNQEIKVLIQNINDLSDKINELIKEINELKKGK